MERLALLCAFALVMSTSVIAGDGSGGCGGSGCVTDNPIVITPLQGDGCGRANCAVPEPVPRPA